jgi:hypothetical protein
MNEALLSTKLKDENGSDHLKRSPTFFWISLWLGCSLIAVGCRLPTLNQLNSTRNEPNRTEIVGTWVPDEASLRAMHEKGGYDISVQPKLALNNDGSFELANMPDWWSDVFGKSSKEFESYSGNWMISKSTQVYVIELRPVSGTRLGTRFGDLVGQSPPYRIDFVIGDADENNSMTFIRK